MNNTFHTQFSIVVPVYNGENYLKRCINSILSQTHTDYEVVFIDDGSTDHSASVIKPYCGSKIKLIRQENLGVSAARNCGISNSRYPYIAFLDVDDEWYPNHLSTVSILINKYKNGGIYSTGFKKVHYDGTPPIEIYVESNNDKYSVVNDPFKVWSVAVVSNSSNSVVKRSVIYEAGLFKEGEKENEDIDLWIRIATKRPLVVSSLVTSIYHITGNDKKPRFNTWPKYILSCRTAASILANSDIKSINNRSVVEYIRSWIYIYFWNFVYSNAKEPLIVLLNNSFASIYAPVLNRIVRVPILWAILRIASYIRRPFKSLLLLHFMGGQRKKNNVVTKIAINGSFSWRSYFVKKRQKREVNTNVI